jgi:hypothetical protein
MIFFDNLVWLRDWDLGYWNVTNALPVAVSDSEAKTWDELQNADISNTRYYREDHKSYALQAQSRFSDRPSLCKTINQTCKVDLIFYILE